MMNSWEWSDTWLAILAFAAVALASLGTYAAFQDHTVRFYYMSDHGSMAGRSGYCIDGYREWYANDSGVFCSDEIQKTVTVLKELNDGLAARRSR
jgi:hypothetical protein